MPNISLEGRERGKKEKCDFHSSYLMENVIFDARSILQATENAAVRLD